MLSIWCAWATYEWYRLSLTVTLDSWDMKRLGVVAGNVELARHTHAGMHVYGEEV